MSKQTTFEWTLGREDALITLWDGVLTRQCIADVLGATLLEIDRKALEIGLDTGRKDATAAQRMLHRDMGARDRAEYRLKLQRAREQARIAAEGRQTLKEIRRAKRQRELARERNRRWKEKNPEWVKDAKRREYETKRERGTKSAYHEADYEARMAISLKRANIMHLVDLKRAGHSPRHTELALPPDEKGIRHFAMSTTPISYCGSPAASCAGF